MNMNTPRHRYPQFQNAHSLNPREHAVTLKSSLISEQSFSKEGNVKKLTNLLILTALLSGCLADIRPDASPTAVNTSSQERGRTLIEQAAQRQGTSKWAQYGTYEVVGTDHWKGLLGRAGNPWPQNRVDVSLKFSYGDFDGRATFLHDKRKGEVWGVQSHRTYREKNGERKFKQKSQQAFILAAYHYFFEFPERLKTVPVVRWTGTEKIGGKEYDVVYASWSEEPSKEYDQYLLYVGRDSGLIEKAQYTLRDFAKFATGTIHFDDWREVGGGLFPYRQTITTKVDSKEKKYLHQLVVERVELGNFPKTALVVDPNLPETGDRKM